jgi:hypothetical protein
MDNTVHVIPNEATFARSFNLGQWRHIRNAVVVCSDTYGDTDISDGIINDLDELIGGLDDSNLPAGVVVSEAK